MKIRKLIERKSVVAERVNLEAARKPDARDLFLQAKMRRQMEADRLAEIHEVEAYKRERVANGGKHPTAPKAELVEVVEDLKRGGRRGR